MKKLLFILLMLSACGMNAYSQNPYLPLWEYIPDSEPYVFEDPDCPGKFRVYIYGSHDSLKDAYCGLEQVVWSAPVDDLSQWRYDGVIYRNAWDGLGRQLFADGHGDLLYAPDVAVTVGKDGKKLYWLYPNIQCKGREGLIAVSDRPDGPFRSCNYSKENPFVSDGVLRFDPAVLVDDDGRVYGYWGFEQSFAAELDPNTMSTVKEGCSIVTDLVPSYKQDDVFRFFEASSIRKIKDKYVFIYSRWTKDGDFGLGESNYTLAYAYSDNPLGPFVYGGTIIDGRARDVDDNGKSIYTAHCGGNTHGSIAEINGKWWVFYHRQTGLDEYSRQAMVAPIEVSVQTGKGGKVTISEGEYTSEGFSVEGLDPFRKTPAGIACWYTHPDGMSRDYPKYMMKGSYVEATRIDWNSYVGPYNQKLPLCPVVNNTDRSVVGYKYMNFSKTAKSKRLELIMHLVPEGIDGKITVLVGGCSEARGGKVIGCLDIRSDAQQEMTEYAIPLEGMKSIKGKQPLFFVFASSTPDKSVCKLYDFQFRER